MKNLKSLLKFFIGLLIIILSILIWPIIRFKFGILIAERIGHLANTFDNYIYSRNSRGNFEFAIFHINSSISNIELLRLWKINQKRIIFSNLAKIVIHTSRKFKLGKKLIIDWDEMETIPKKSNTKERYINFDKKFFTDGQLILKKNNIQEPFICFTSRDDAYVDKRFDKNYHDFIDFNFKKFNKSINYLIDKGNSIIRVTKKTNIEYQNPSKKYFFLTDNRTDHSDIFFLSQSKYNIFGSYHGITNISGICRKKSLYLNYIPFHLGSLSTMSKFSVFVPKKIFSIKEDRFLKFYEINDLINLKYNIHYKGNFFSDNNLEVVDNTETEVFTSIKEFDENYNQDFEISQSELQKKFWNSFTDNDEIKLLRNKLCISISETFLENNKDLI
tara:strand:+ start:644 stop:1807 length:1164 start_codon:yes stop_codon:yes gene_type:complete